jgi:hypothetical protein
VPSIFVRWIGVNLGPIAGRALRFSVSRQSPNLSIDFENKGCARDTNRCSSSHKRRNMATDRNNVISRPAPLDVNVNSVAYALARATGRIPILGAAVERNNKHSRILQLPTELRQEIIFRSIDDRELAQFSALKSRIGALRLVCNVFKQDVVALLPLWKELRETILGHINIPPGPLRPILLAQAAADLPSPRPFDEYIKQLMRPIQLASEELTAKNLMPGEMERKTKSRQGNERRQRREKLRKAQWDPKNKWRAERKVFED